MGTLQLAEARLITSSEGLPAAIFEDNDEKREKILNAVGDLIDLRLDIRTYGAGKKNLKLLGEFGVEVALMDGSLRKGDSQNPIRQGDTLATELHVLEPDIKIVSISAGRPVLHHDFHWQSDVGRLRDYLSSLQENT